MNTSYHPKRVSAAEPWLWLKDFLRFQLNKDFEIRVFVDLMIFSLAPKALMLSGPLTGHISGFEARIQPCLKLTAKPLKIGRNPIGK